MYIFNSNVKKMMARRNQRKGKNYMANAVFVRYSSWDNVNSVHFLHNSNLRLVVYL